MRSPLRLMAHAAQACLVLSVALSGMVQAQDADGICRVTTAGSAGNDGATWAASMSLQTALTTAGCTKVWVAAGVYTPGSAAADTFDITPGVKVYGGFVGGETSLDARNPAVNVTILSGDIDANDANGDGNFVDESYNAITGTNSTHVVTMNGATGAGKILANTVLDGFTITGGDDHNDYDGGGGLRCYGSGSGHACSPALNQLVFAGNKAQLGGGMAAIGYSGEAAPTLTNVTFVGNHAGYEGGGLFNQGADGAPNPTLTGVSFINNSSASSGAAIYNNGTGGASSPSLTNVTFSGNHATLYGGGMFNQGASGISSPVLVNVTFAGNRAQYGGAIYDHGDNGTCAPTLTNVILWGDSATAAGPEIEEDSCSAHINFSVVDGGCPTGSVCSHGILASPQLGTLRDNGGYTLTMLPGAGGSAIDAGTDANGVCPATDQRGFPRPQGTTCDIGAVETGTCLVDAAATGANNGSRWADAYTDLQSALGDDACTEIWVAAGVYVPGSAASDSFNIAPGVAVYGGFAGNESSRDARDPAANATILSGDIAGDDSNTDGNHIDESYTAIVGTNSAHVVTMDGTTGAGVILADTVLDGFVVTGGNGLSASGGGLYCNGRGAGFGCNPTLGQLYFVGNSAANGGAIVDDGALGGNSSPTLTDITFRGNHADGDGGAVDNAGYQGGQSSPVLKNVTFVDNHGEWGGAMQNDGYAGTSSPTLTNVTLIGNHAESTGGAMEFDGRDGGTSNPVLSNVIVWDNTASGAAGLHVLASSMTIDHSIVQGTDGSGSAWWGAVGVSDGGGNLDTDPLLAPLADNGGLSPTLRPGYGSPAVDAGTCVLGVDQRGVSRPQGTSCDIGAVETTSSELDRIFADGFESQ